jgi:hypothetical protein
MLEKVAEDARGVNAVGAVARLLAPEIAPCQRLSALENAVDGRTSRPVSSVSAQA